MTTRRKGTAQSPIRSPQIDAFQWVFILSFFAKTIAHS